MLKQLTTVGDEQSWRSHVVSDTNIRLFIVSHEKRISIETSAEHEAKPAALVGRQWKTFVSHDSIAIM